MRTQLLIVATLLTAAAPATFATNAPAEPCSLLPAAEVSKALGQAVAAPQPKVAPRPYKDTAQGTNCLYKSASGRESVVFIIYFDSSPAQSKDLFKRLAAFYGENTAAPGVGDEAYIDSHHALHARKGNVRFYLEANGVNSRTREKTLTNLGAGVAGRL
ncbi:MAG TPA: hypothetical protein VFE23_07620 [Usitatibacter sp.]|nr:hypothetical protein [Usitatibacter sp.]